MALCKGGPVVLPGMVTDVVSARRFQDECCQALQELYGEVFDSDEAGVQDDVPDDDIRVDDLRVMTDFELVEHALRHEEEEPESRGNVASGLGTVAKGNSEKSRKRKVADVNVERARKRRESSALDGKKIAFYQKLKQERELAKETAKKSLHSLQGEKTPDRRRNTSSVISAPLLRNSFQEQQGRMEAFDAILTVEVLTERRKVQEFSVLGSQPLTALRDQLYCMTDTLAARESMAVPSGYFLIENTFYNDMRHGEAVDYSEPLLKYLERRKKRKRKFNVCYRSARMEETLFMDIDLRLGVKYIYCHNGDCKHGLIFRDMRLLNCEDPLDPGHYPVLKFVAWFKYRKCSICGVYRARKVTYDDEAVPNSPCFFCIKCFEMLHGGENKTGYRVIDYHEH